MDSWGVSGNLIRESRRRERPHVMGSLMDWRSRDGDVGGVLREED